jgi:hypothetical protein
MTLADELAQENRRYAEEARVAEDGYAAKLAPIIAALESAKAGCAADSANRIYVGRANKAAIISRHRAADA